MNSSVRDTAVAVVLCVLVGTAVARAQGEPQVPREGGSPLPRGSLQLSSSAQNPLMGGVPKGTVQPEALPLSLSDALARGLQQNLGVILGQQQQRAAGASRWQAYSNLLPNASLHLSQAREEINLEEFGFPVAPGESPIIGPFNVSALHLTASAPILDYSVIQGVRAGHQAVSAAKHGFKDTRDLVVSMTASLYLQAVTGASQIQAAKAQLQTAQALYDRAVAMKQAGVVAGIEVLRAQVQLQAQQQRVIYYENEFAKQKLSLARAIGVPLGQQISLTDAMPYAPMPPTALEQSLKEAYASREDLQSAVAMVKAAEANKQAAIGQSLPSLRANLDLGRSSSHWDTLHGTYAVTAMLVVPIFQGGREIARVQQADAQLQQQRAQLDDLRARIEYDVRSATLDLQAADDRVRVARGAADLAQQQLTQAQDRFTAGVTSNIEVVQAQEALATATDNYLSALFAHNVAKIALARAVGVSEERVGTFLKGGR